MSNLLAVRSIAGSDSVQVALSSAIYVGVDGRGGLAVEETLLGRKIEVFPKSPAYVIGEQVVRPIVDFVVILSSRVFSAINQLSTKTFEFFVQGSDFIPSFPPGASAQEVFIDDKSAHQREAGCHIVYEIADALGIQCSGNDNIDELELSCFYKLYEKCRSGQWDLVHRFKGDLSQIHDSAGQTLLMKAIADWDEEIIHEFAKRETLVQGLDNKGNGVLHSAVQCNLPIELFTDLTRLVDINRKNYDGVTPLNLAIQLRRNNLVRVIASNNLSNANIPHDLAEDHPGKLNSLGVAVQVGNTEAIDILLETTSVAIEHTTYCVGNIIHIAVNHYQVGAIEHLISKHKAKIKSLINSHAGELESRSPIGLAAFLGYDDLVELLHLAGGDVFYRDPIWGKTAMHHAASGQELSTTLVLYKIGGREIFYIEDREHLRPLELVPIGSPTRNLIANLMSGEIPHEVSCHVDHPKNLVFQGSRSEAYAFSGVISQLHEMGAMRHVERVTGTSGGAIASVFVALGMEPERIEAVILNTSFNQFLDFSLLERLKKWGEKSINLIQGTHFILSEFREHIADENFAFSHEYLASLSWRLLNFIGYHSLDIEGACEGESFRLWIEEIIREETGIEYLTLGELHELAETDGRYKDIHLFALQLKPQEGVRFSSESHEQKNYILSDLICITNMFPGVFKPHQIHIKQKHGGGSTQRVELPEYSYVNGDLFRSFPIDAFDLSTYMKSRASKGVAYPLFNEETKGFRFGEPIKSGVQKGVFSRNLDSFVDLVKGLDPTQIAGDGVDLAFTLLDVLRRTEELVYYSRGIDASRVCEIVSTEMRFYDWSLSNDRKRELIELARSATEKCLRRDSKEIPRQFELKGWRNLSDQTVALFGREDVFSQIENQFKWFENGLGYSLAILLKGEPGIGKTGVGTAFAKHFYDHFSLIWKIDAEDPVSYYTGYESLANILDIPVQNAPISIIVDKVHRRLSEHQSPKPWLLLFCNMRESKPLPSQGGVTIITTDNDSLELEVNQIITVERLSDESIEGLIKDLLEDSPDLLLAKVLNGNPKAAHLAARYLFLSGEDSKKLAQELAHLPDNKSVTKYLYKMLAKLLKESNSNTHRVLQLISCLNMSEFSQSMLTAYTRQLELLDEHGFINLVEVDPPNAIHTQVQIDRELMVAVKEGLESGERLAYLEQALALISSGNALVEAMLCEEIAAQYLLLGNPEEATKYYEEAILHYFSVGSAKTKLVGDLRVEVARIVKEAGDYSGALEQYNQAKAVFAHIDGPRTLKVAQQIENIGQMLIAQGKHGEALRHFEEALQIFIENCGDKNVAVAITYQHIAFALSVLKRNKRSDANFRKSQEIFAQISDSESLEVAYVIEDIGQTLFSQRQYAKATKYFREVLQIFLRNYDETNLAVKNCHKHIGDCLKAQRKNKEAQKHFKKANAP